MINSEPVLNLVQIAPCFVDLEAESGGVANIVRQICLNLATKPNCQVHLLCGNREMGVVKAEPSVQHIENVRQVIYHQHRHPLMGPSKQLCDEINRLPENSVSHVHTCFSMFSETAMGSLNKRQIPTVFTPHGKLSDSMFATNGFFKNIWWNTIAKSRVSKAKIVCSSPVESEQIEKNAGLIASDHVPNGFQLDDTDHSNELLISKPYVLFLGYLDPRKQPCFLVEAFSKSAAKDSHLLVIAGPDTYGHQTEIQKTINQLGMNDKVIIYGPAFGAEKWNLLRNASCFCLPSQGEGMPVVLTEALGAGTPSISSPQCNFSHIASSGVGITCDIDSTDDWSKAIDDLCLNSEFQNELHQTCVQLQNEFNWKAIANKWFSVYNLLRKSYGQSGPNQ